MSTEIRLQRERWFKEHPYCYWCKCQLVLIDTSSYRGRVPDNAATIDHLRPKGHPNRRERNRFHLWRRVLACWKCNNDRDREFTRRRSLEELWRASGHWMQMVRSTGMLNEVAA